MTDCDWCGDAVPSQMLMEYCSTTCENSALRHAVDVMEAAVAGDDIPEKPAARGSDPKVIRWSPSKMQSRVKALERQAANVEEDARDD